MANDGNLYQVSSIVGKKEVNGRSFYKVQWTGYSREHDSWEPENNLSNCKSLMDSFLANEGMITRSGTRITRPDTVLSSDEEVDNGSSTPRSRRLRYSIPRSRRRKSANTNKTPPKSPIKTKRPATAPRRTQHITTRDLTPSRYYLRHTTMMQRPPLHGSCISSDDENTTPTGPVKRMSRRDLHDEVVSSPPTKLPKPDPKQESPVWLNLGVAEMVLCLLILAMVIVSFWYVQSSVKVTST